jgi:hypothetical protein
MENLLLLISILILVDDQSIFYQIAKAMDPCNVDLHYLRGRCDLHRYYTLEPSVFTS